MKGTKRKQATLLIIISMLVAFCLGVGLTYAYFSDSKTASNTLNFGKLIISLTDSSGTASKTISLSGSATDTETNRLAPGDKVTITGNVGLETGSTSAYIRMRVRVYEKGTDNLIVSTFDAAFMEAMSKIVYKDSSEVEMQWFKIGNYLYLGNKIVAEDPFVYSSANIYTGGTETGKNEITLTKEMVPVELQGKDVDVRLVYQAIQSAGMGLTLNNYTQANATSISQLAVWQEIFGKEVDEIYSSSSEYVTGCVMGTLIEVDSTTYKAGAQVKNQMTKSPYNYFAKATESGESSATGDYVAFGFYPQTIKESGVRISEERQEVFNGKQYYLGSDGYLYEGVIENGYDSNYKYSDGTTIKKSSSENSTQYFKLEPIIWEVKTTTDSKMMLVSVSELTAMKYYGDTLTRTISGTTINANNYKYSYIRSYLNGLTKYGPNNTTTNVSETSDEYQGKGLLQTAFTSQQQNSIKGTTIDSSTTMTEDKLFLLSNSEQSSLYLTDTNRIKYPTDYAGATGACRDSSTANYGGLWWSRSAYSSTNVWSVRSDGDLVDYSPTYAGRGVVPALFLSI